MSNDWLLWQDGAHSPFFNMAADELLLQNAGNNSGRAILRIYRWDRPALSIGASQSFPDAESARYTIVRRPTGGGNVYHDCDLTYTVVAPPEHALMRLDRMESYRVFHAAMLPMFDMLGVCAELKSDEPPKVERATMKCFTSPSKFDIMGRHGKYAGAAQRRTRTGLLHQGSISLEASSGDWERLNAALVAALKSHFEINFAPFEPSTEFMAEADALAKHKYADREWNHGA